MAKLDQETLDRLHNVLLELLHEFKRICDKNNISYFLDSGTLLGAVRHKGFIPWDDDVDIGMFRKDYDSFVKICKYELNSKYCLQAIETNEYRVHPYAKIHKNGTLFLEEKILYKNEPTGIFIDIFVFDFIIKNKILNNLQQFAIKKLQNITSLKQQQLDGKNRLWGRCKKAVYFFIPLKLLQTLKRIVMMTWLKTGKYVTSWFTITGFDSVTNPVDVILPLATLEFEGKTYSVPGNYDQYLRKLYGDYMIPPPRKKNSA